MKKGILIYHFIGTHSRNRVTGVSQTSRSRLDEVFGAQRKVDLAATQKFRCVDYGRNYHLNQLVVTAGTKHIYDRDPDHVQNFNCNPDDVYTHPDFRN